MKTNRTSWDEADLPPEVRRLGRPLHTHGPAAVLRAVDRITGAARSYRGLNRGGLNPAALTRLEVIIFWVGAVFFLALVPLFLCMYFFVPMVGAPQELGLGLAGFSLLAGVGSLVLALRCRSAREPAGEAEPEEDRRRPTGATEAQEDRRQPSGHRRTYLVFREALAVVRDGEWMVVRWDEVRELQSPTITGRSFQLVPRQGRAVPIDQWVENYGGLIQAVVDRVKEVLLPPALDALAAGDRLKFGPFHVSRRGLTYKGKKLRWQDVTRMVLEVGANGRRLTVRRRGGLFGWCWYDINRIPNNDVFYHILCHAAPAHLLKPSDPRWAAQE
jgi:hypothetical protein